MPFIAIQKLRDLVNASFSVHSRADRDILIDLAAAQQQGQVLTMKQLVILQSESPTTTRRRIRNLFASGKVVKVPNSVDGRTETYGVAEHLWEKSSEVRAALKEVYLDQDSRSKKSERSQRKRKPNA